MTGPGDSAAGGGTADGPWVGRPMLRREDERLLRGDGVYVDDMRPEGLVHMVALRSPAARARLGTIDTSRAAEAPGVLAVLTAEDLQGLPGSMAVTAIEGAEVAAVPVPLLGAGEVRFAGEPVAVVVAESRAAAEDARELVEVDYRSLPVVMDVEESLAARTSLHAAAPDNVLVRWHRRHGDVAAAFAAADHVVSARLNVPRLAAAPIEPRGCIASYDQGKDLLTLWCSAQDPHRPLANLAAVLGRPAERIRVVVPEVGGAFGSKGPLAPEHALAAVCAMRLGRPVKWVEDRTETFLASYQGRGLGAEASLAVDRTGRFLALQARLVADLGAYLYPNTAIVPVTAGMLVTGAYDVPAAEVDVLGVATDKVPTGPYRGAGRPEAAYVVERLTDLAAAELGMDPVDVRRRNLVQPDQFPYRTALGFTYDSGDYEGALVRACELLPYRAWRRQQAAAAEGRREGAAAEGRRLGIGLAVFVERAGSGLWEGASVDLGRDGRVVVRMGSCPHGQGHETTFAQIAADALGVAPAQVEVRHGDSAEGPPGVGTYGSRSTTVGGSALVVAAEAVLAKARALAAHVLEAAEEDLLWSGGGFSVAGSPGRGVGLVELAALAHDPARLPPGLEPGLEAAGRFSLPGPVFSFGAYAAVVEVELETGELRLLRLVAVDDAGTVVNPRLAEGQVAGSSVQGVAAALLEEVVYDKEGQLLTGSFIDYAVPSAADITFEMESELRRTPSPLNPLGAKGLGESGTIAVPAAIANAVADALTPMGIRHVDPPYRPETLWRLIQGGATRLVGAGTARTGG